MPDIAVEKVLAEIQALTFEQRRELRRLLNGSSAASPAEPLMISPPRILGRGAPGKDRSREKAWMENHASEYANQWVALDGDRLISHGPKFGPVINEARKQGVPDALVAFVEPKDALPFLMLWN